MSTECSLLQIRSCNIPAMGLLFVSRTIGCRDVAVQTYDQQLGDMQTLGEKYTHSSVNPAWLVDAAPSTFAWNSRLLSYTWTSSSGWSSEARTCLHNEVSALLEFLPHQFYRIGVQA